jgi:ssDNA-binding Zn-finger/Zn-ribbon topoisomerase 1
MFFMAGIEKKICSRCGEEMELKEASFPMGSALSAQRFHVDIYSCPKCNKVELFAAESDVVTCPVCGHVHPAREKCVRCALSTAFDGSHTGGNAYI